MQFSAPSLVATVFGLIATDMYTANTTELSTGYIDESVVPIFNFLYKINDGKRIIQDYCEMIESDSTMFNMKSGTKPNCLNNHSFIDSNDTIKNFTITEKEIDELIIKRKIAKENKEYDKADQIREKLLRKNIQLEDKPDKTVWRRLKIR